MARPRPVDTPPSRLAELVDLHRSEGRLTGLEGLRGLAVALVFFVHLEFVTSALIPRDGLTRTISTGLHNAGSVGVDIFYVLSGFLIYGGLMGRPRPFRPFLARRIQRIYPTFLFILALYVVLSIAVPSESKMGSNPLGWPFVIAINALLIPGVVPVERMITVAGTLSFEMLFYITIPLVIGRFGLRERSAEERASFWKRAGLILALLVLPVNSPYQRILMFLGGVLLWEFLERRRRDDRPVPPAVVGRMGLAGLTVALTLAFFIDLGEYGGIPRALVLFVALPPFVASTIVGGHPLHRLVSSNPLRALGNISYSYYLTHGLVLKVIEKGLDTWFNDTARRSIWYWAAIIPCFALTFIGSLMVYLLVEKPYSLGRRPLPVFDRAVARIGGGPS